MQNGRYFFTINVLQIERQEESMKEIKVVVTYNEGYEKRFTQACLDVLKKREVREKNG